jgi:hypothetical protein
MRELLNNLSFVSVKDPLRDPRATGEDGHVDRDWHIARIEIDAIHFPDQEDVSAKQPSWYSFDLVSPEGEIVGGGTIYAPDADRAIHSARLMLAGPNEVVLSRNNVRFGSLTPTK